MVDEEKDEKVGMDTSSLQGSRGCADCGHTVSKVIDSRYNENGIIKRRRKCEKCGFRWNTYEIAEDDLGYLLDMEAESVGTANVSMIKKEMMKTCRHMVDEIKGIYTKLEKMK